MPLPPVEPTILLVDSSPLIHLAMIGALDLPLRFGPVIVNVGEHAIVNWLGDNISGFGAPAIVVYENGKIPNMLIREGFPDDVIVVTSRTFLTLASQAGFLDDPDVAWAIVAANDESHHELSGDPGAPPMTDAELEPIVRRYVDCEITVEHAADLIGPGTAVVDVILAAKRLFGRLPDRHDAFTENEYRRALKILGLDRAQ